MNDIYKKFPPNRKEEFLNWVKLTQPKDSWTKVVYDYILLYQLNTWKEGFDFVVEWSNDPTFVAFLMVNNCHVNPNWALDVIEDVIENDENNSRSVSTDTEYKIVLARKTGLKNK